VGLRVVSLSLNHFIYLFQSSGVVASKKPTFGFGILFLPVAEDDKQLFDTVTKGL
jgi:hypothetical protein